MPLIVEDGSCVVGADSFVSLADANTYFENYGGFWTGDDPSKEAALRRASAYVSTAFKWLGTLTCGRNQSLAWPRTGVTDCNEYEIPADSVPREVVLATLSAASYELLYPGGLTPSVTAGKQALKEKVDVIEVTYMTPEQQGLSGGDAVAAQRPVLTQINDLLRCFASFGNETPWPLVV